MRPHALMFLAAGLLFVGCSEEKQAPVYQLVPVSTRNIVVSASAAGVIEPILTVDIKSKASGELLEMRVDVGDVVEPGQLLVKIDPRVPSNALRQAQADLDVAKASLTNAQAQLRRAEELFKTQSITETEYEQANLTAANARAQLIRAERNGEDAQISFEDTDVRAPSRGVIIQKNVEVGTVISSAVSNVGGGAVLLQMANLDTIQVRALVDETDIGKIQPGMEVTVTVEAYLNRPFQGRVLKIEPQALVQQNVTMFPVLVRIANQNDMLKPGMNAEVEVHIGERQNVLAVPVAALRTDRDVASAAAVLGLEPQRVQEQITEARQLAARPSQEGTPTSGQPTSTNGSKAETVSFMGREVPVPEGYTAEQVRAVFTKMQQGGGPQSLSGADRAILEKMRGSGGGQGRRQQQSDDTALFGGNYIVFAMRNGEATPVPISTGLTDLDYSEVVRGLSAADTVLIMPSASLLAQQQEFQERVQQRAGGLPGVSRN
ncbi:MAG: efflux RND transporter periplasmic adaptor subunit [Gemmatimonadota bacterium]|nr:efflux RND transporter periplasmic adaptor subunit [Gemmatimonadota bacterium]MDH3478416.1 efflux RND transporter periplasmic adaptor subunit [Gemmatimonadota bacterium]MDH3568763.1 efflux RND transporter periplasmic adaptor subunit [Gemmatimonadota bacterium]MDH5549378.1 efflux RND transporter periplasmic adaptor subunit [Gemmatimonadota bacterium]